MHLASFRTIRANINFIAAAEHGGTEVSVGFAMPKLVESGCFEVAEQVFGVFVEAAGHHEAVPCDYASMPQFPAMFA